MTMEEEEDSSSPVKVRLCWPLCEAVLTSVGEAVLTSVGEAGLASVGEAVLTSVGEAALASVSEASRINLCNLFIYRQLSECYRLLPLNCFMDYLIRITGTLNGGIPASTPQ